MKIELKKFGDLLISIPAGREAFLTAKAYLRPQSKNETIQLDFAGVEVLGPSWADEFITALKEEFENPIEFLPSDNLSVIQSLKILE